MTIINFAKYLFVVAAIVGLVKCDCADDYEGMDRTYCLGVVEIEWNYAPNSTSAQMDLTNTNEENAEYYISSSSTTIGSIYKKSLFRRYKHNKDGCDWETIVEQPKENGIMGPVLRVVVGDTLIVYLKNMATYSQSFSVNGLLNADESVAPGEIHKYELEIDESAGPSGDSDMSSTVWIYRSDVEFMNDAMSGLIGALIVYSDDGVEEDSLAPCDVDQEIVLLMCVFDENESNYLEDNAETLTDEGDTSAIIEDSDFQATNKKYSINGYIFGNLQPDSGLRVTLGERVRWYGLGISAADTDVVQSIQWAGNNVYWSDGQMRDYVALSSPGYAVVDMEPYNLGQFLISSGILGQADSGMLATYEVMEAPETKEDSVASLGKGIVYGLFVIVIIIGVLGIVVISVRTYYSVKKQDTDFQTLCLDESSRSTHSGTPMTKGTSSSYNSSKSSGSSSNNDSTAKQTTVSPVSSLASAFGMSRTDDVDDSERMKEKYDSRTVEI